MKEAMSPHSLIRKLINCENVKERRVALEASWTKILNHFPQSITYAKTTDAEIRGIFK